MLFVNNEVGTKVKIMNKKLILIFFVLNGVFCHASYDNLRLVAGYPNYHYEDLDSDYVAVSSILRIDGDSLIEEIALSDSSHILFFVRMYQEYDELFALSVKRGKGFQSQIFADSATSQLYVVDTKTLEKKIFDIPYSIYDRGIEYEVLKTGTNFIRQDSISYLFFDCMNFGAPRNGNIPRMIYYALNTKTGSFEKADVSVLRGLISNNHKLLFRDIADGTILRGDESLKSFSISVPQYYGEIPFFDESIANINIDKQILKKGGGVLVNTDRVIALCLYGDKYFEKNGMKIRCFYVYNKENMQWIPVQINTNTLFMEYYNGYMCGHQNIDIRADELSLTSSYWTKPQTKYGPEYCLDLEDEECNWSFWAPYSNGDLFLYHVNTKNKIEWNTGHGDSEILLVKDEVVYYRVYDKIYCAKIIDHKSLDTPELIIQNTLVGDVHWAFFRE